MEKKQEKRLLLPETHCCTIEGQIADAKEFDKAGFGCIFLKNSELLLELQGKNKDIENVIKSIIAFYDGDFYNKSIKGENRVKINNKIPINALLYSDYTLFDDKLLKTYFERIMHTGLARRATISFAPIKTIEKSRFTDAETRAFHNKIVNLGEKLYSIFEQLRSNATFVLLADSKEIHNDYHDILVDKENSEKNELLKKEIRSRHFKAIKLGNLFASCNHPTDERITIEDMEQGISITEYLSYDFKAFLQYKRHILDIYDNVFEFFKEHQGEKFKQTDFVNKHCQDFGCSRKKFRDQLDEIIEIVQEIAVQNGFTLVVEPAKKNGKYFYLISNIQNNLPDNVVELNRVING